MKRAVYISFSVLLFTVPIYAFCQLDSAAQKTDQFLKLFSGKLLKSTERKYKKLAQKLGRSNSEILTILQTQENDLRNQLSQKDSLGAVRLFGNTKKIYRDLEWQATQQVDNKSLKEYIPGLDSMQTLFKFLEKSGPGVPGISVEKLKQVESVSKSINQLQSQLQYANNIKSFIRERKKILTEQFSSIGLVGSLKNINSKAYYYQQQLNDFKSLLHDPDKLQQKALSIIKESGVFKDFFLKNSQFAALFGSSGGASSAGLPIPGLQTRVTMQQQLTQSLGSSGNTNPQQYLNQQVGQAKSELDVLKEKINKAGATNSDEEIPDFKPNKQKTKSFLSRIELGINIQSQKTTGLLPTTSDLALTAGYKLNDKSVIGIGAGYKIGWGRNISNIRISSQGISFRSFIDVKLKGSFWISGGYETNFQQEFTRIEQLKNLNAWQTSGLIGLTKKYKVGKKNGNMQLLWDFLSYNQLPRTQPIKFRIGYTL